MKTVHKALAAVIRDGPLGPEVLVFQHPLAGVQMPKGTVEAGEDTKTATLRELHEESGLDLRDQPECIGTWDRIVGGGPKEEGAPEINRWWISVIRHDGALPDRWDHRAEGSPAEDGLIFSFFWLPINAQLPQALHPLFAQVAKMIIDHFCASQKSAASKTGSAL